jgi:hypothetical protein
MTTSGSINYTQTRDQLILDAYQHLGVYGVLGLTITDAHKQFAINQLNKMIKAWETQGLHLWCKEEAVLFLQPNQAEYVISNDTTSDYCAALGDSVITATATAAAISATSLSLLTTVGMTVGDYIGVVLADNTVFWTTIATIPTTTTLTLTLGLTQSAVSGSLVYTFTTKINKPLRILSARRVRGYDNGSTGTITEVLMSDMSYQDYQNMTSKYISGVPNQFTYNPRLTTGNLFLWQRPNDGNDRIHFTYERILEDMDNISDNFDLPSEWLEALTWQLALRLGPAFGRGSKALNEIAPIAQAALENLKNWDNEITYVNMYPDIRR